MPEVAPEPGCPCRPATRQWTADFVRIGQKPFWGTFSTRSCQFACLGSCLLVGVSPGLPVRERRSSGRMWEARPGETASGDQSACYGEVSVEGLEKSHCLHERSGHLASWWQVEGSRSSLGCSPTPRLRSVSNLWRALMLHGTGGLMGCTWDCLCSSQLAINVSYQDIGEFGPERVRTGLVSCRSFLSATSLKLVVILATSCEPSADCCLSTSRECELALPLPSSLYRESLAAACLLSFFV